MNLLRFNKLISFKIVELLVSVLIILLSYSIPLHILDYGVSNSRIFNFMAVFIAVISILVFLIAEYTNGEKISKSRNILKVFLCALTIAMIITSLAFFLRGFSFPRSLIILGFLIQIFSLSLSRIVFRSLIRSTINNKILIIGIKQEQDWLFEKTYISKLPNEEVKGYFSVDEEGVELINIIAGYSKVFISDHALKKINDETLSILNQYNVELVLIPRKYEISVWGAIIVPLGDSLAMNVKNFGLSIEAQIVKRIFDIIFSTIFIIISFPIMLLIAVLIYLEDRQNPFFLQERITKNNKKFKLIKFRSMEIGAEDNLGPVWAIDNDCRITSVGKLIRPLWLDELPQFFNVLVGDMSIVGPRPERPELIEEFINQTPEFSYRTKIKAGITGYAQVLTNYTTLPENKLKLDLVYIRRWSFIFDLLIMIETFRVICIKLIKLIFPKRDTLEIEVKKVANKNYTEYLYE